MTAPPIGRAELVSIIIPCFNPGRFLSEAVESALAQTYAPIEVVVADDGSSEDVRGLLARFSEVRYVRQPNSGVAAARNLGARESGGAFLVFLDADDRLLPDAVAVGLERLRARPNAAFAAGLCYPIGADGERLPFRQQPEVRRDPFEEMLEANFIWMPAQVIYRRETFQASGGFDRSVDACADYELYLRLIRHHPIVLHRHAVAEYRFHGTNMSGNKAVMLASALEVLHRQWPYAKRHPAYRRAYYTGRRFWRQFYGGPLVEEIRAGIKSRQTRSQALRGAAVLLRHHPIEALRQVGRKLRVLLFSKPAITR